MSGEGDKGETVKCRCGHLEGSGTYEVSDNRLVLRSTFGVKQALLGFALPRRLAQRLLKNACEREATKQRAAIGSVKPGGSEVLLGAQERT